MRFFVTTWVLATAACGATQRTEAPGVPLTAAPHEYADAATPAVVPVAASKCDREHELARAETRAFLMDSKNLMRQARAVPVPHDAGAFGMRLAGILPDSPLRTWGLENGDELVSVNDMDVSSPESALAVYASAREATSLRIVVLRAGALRTLCLELTD